LAVVCDLLPAFPRRFSLTQAETSRVHGLIVRPTESGWQTHFRRNWPKL